MDNITAIYSENGQSFSVTGFSLMGQDRTPKELPDTKREVIGYYPAKFRSLLGEVIKKIEVNEDKTDVLFITEHIVYKMFHDQDCCEHVYLADVDGDFNDLIDSPILLAEEAVGNQVRQGFEYQDESFTWTFYTLATIKGRVTLRWLGASNGYYSESVDIMQVNYR